MYTHTHSTYADWSSIRIHTHTSIFCPKFNPAFKCIAHTQLPQTPVIVLISELKLVYLEHLRHEAQLHFWYYFKCNLYCMWKLMILNKLKENHRICFGFLNKHFSRCTSVYMVPYFTEYPFHHELHLNRAETGGRRSLGLSSWKQTLTYTQLNCIITSVLTLVMCFLNWYFRNKKNY